MIIRLKSRTAPSPSIVCKSPASVAKFLKEWASKTQLPSVWPLTVRAEECVKPWESHHLPALRPSRFRSSYTVAALRTDLSQFSLQNCKLTPSPLWLSLLVTLGSAGLIVITTTSPENFEFLKSRGADAVLDYHDPDCAKKIREFTHNELRRVFDTVGLPQTAKICADAMAPSAENGELRYTSSIPVQAFPRDDVTNTNYLAYDAVGESYEMFGINFPAVPENYEFAKAFWQVATALVQEGKLIPHPAQVNNGGLAGIPAG